MSAWYRTYRPQTLSQLHLADVRTQLQKLFSSGHLPQVLLFTGPRGAGKTSSARIVAATLNEPANLDLVEQHFLTTASTTKKNARTLVFAEPDSNNEVVRRIFAGNSLNVQELDAASNRGIDDVRLLKERLALPPQEGKVSVYILDEVHMLTNEAFNALLKVLEEPPKHVVFILATTEVHKLPETVLSRCTVIQFRKAEPSELVAAVEHVLKSEKVSFESAAVLELAHSVDGSFRDAIKLAEYVVGQSGALTKDSLKATGGLGTQEIAKLVQAIVSKSAAEIISLFQVWRQQHQRPLHIHHQLVSYLHTELTNSVLSGGAQASLDVKVATYLLKQFQDKAITDQESLPFLGLELVCLEIVAKATERKNGNSNGGQGSNKSEADSTKTKQTPKLQAKSSTSLPSSLAAAPDTIESFVTSTESAQELVSSWGEFLQQVNSNHQSIGALLASAQPKVVGTEVHITVFYSFHLEKFRQPVIFTLLHEHAQKCVQQPVSLQFVLGERVAQTAQPDTVSTDIHKPVTLESAVEAYLV